MVSCCHCRLVVALLGCCNVVVVTAAAARCFRGGGQHEACFASSMSEMRRVSSDSPSSSSVPFSRSLLSLRALPDSRDDEGGGRPSWMQELRQRQQKLGQQQADLMASWKKARCESNIALHAPSWIRRLDVQYPLVAFGTAHNVVFVANLETGELLASSSANQNNLDNNSHDNDDTDAASPAAATWFETINLRRTLKLLHGGYDGGGTLAIAFANNLICEAPRLGGVRLWRLDTHSETLRSQGHLVQLEGVLVTALQLSDDYLWVGRSDGLLQVFAVDTDMAPLALQTPIMQHNLGATILSIALHDDLDCAVVSTANGMVHLLHTEDNALTATWRPLFDAGMNGRRKISAFARSACLLQRGHRANDWCVVAGGSDGSLFMQPLLMQSGDEIDWKRPLTESFRAQQLRPKHFGPVVGLAAPPAVPGLLVSAGQDGTLKVWNGQEQRCLYQFVGYKVWLGSLWTDGSRVVSDGSDNTIIMHDFASTVAATQQQQQPNHEEEDTSNDL